MTHAMAVSRIACANYFFLQPATLSALPLLGGPPDLIEENKGNQQIALTPLDRSL
jgi:hypothetical protein